MLNFIVSTETPLSDLTHDSRLIDSLILYTHINRTAVSREKYSMILFFLFTPSPALNIILGHPRSSHSESLSLVLKLFSVLFLTYIGDSWNSLVSYRLQSWNFTLGGITVVVFLGKYLPPRRDPAAAKLDKFRYKPAVSESMYRKPLAKKLKATYFSKRQRSWTRPEKGET